MKTMKNNNTGISQLSIAMFTTQSAIKLIFMSMLLFSSMLLFAHEHEHGDKKGKHSANPEMGDHKYITQTKATQASTTPAMAIEMLKEGNKRFVDQKMIHRDLIAQVEQTAEGQFPIAAVVSCIDSRIPTEMVLDQGVGDIFNARIAGNFVNDDILGSLEFATKVAGAKAIVVMGHTQCGAVKGACDNVELGNLTGMLDKIEPAVKAVTDITENRNSKNAEFVQKVADMNVELTIEKIKTDSPILKEMYDNGEISIVGAMYHVESGKVTFFE